MVLKNLKKIVAFFTITFCLYSAFALEVPSLKARVNDYANIINSNTENELNNYLASLEESTDIQMVVLTVPSLQGEDISSFSIKVAEKWKIGRSGEDDGALLIVALNEREVRIEVGYGLEGKLTDAKCGLIIRNVIIPEFKNGNYSAGIYKGIKNMAGIASDDKELVNHSVAQNKEEDDDWVGMIYTIISIIVFIVIITSKSRRRGIFFFPMFYPTRTRHYGSSHNSSHSSFSGGGFSGPSFHGGGGHFGGGGASGHW